MIESVYIVAEGWDYEGDRVVHVALSEMGAKAWISEYIERLNANPESVHLDYLSLARYRVGPGTEEGLHPSSIIEHYGYWRHDVYPYDGKWKKDDRAKK